MRKSVLVDVVVVFGEAAAVVAEVVVGLVLVLEGGRVVVRRLLLSVRLDLR